MADLTPENYWPLGSTVQETTILTNGVKQYEHFGLISVNPTNGYSVIFYRGGNSHVGSNDYGIIYLRYSTDGGSTWSYPESVVVSEANVDLRNLGGGYDNTGKLFIFYARYFPGHPNQKPPIPTQWLSMNYLYSINDGQTWNAGSVLSTMSQNWYSPYGQIIDAGNDVLYQTWYAGSGSTYKLYLYKSINGGTSFSSVIDINPNPPHNTNLVLTESSMVNLGGGCFLLLVRYDTKINNYFYYYQFKSEDNCVTWQNQGITSFEGLSSNYSAPPYLSFINYEGVGIVACYYTNRGTQKLNVVFGLAKDLLDNGPISWNASTIKEVLSYNSDLFSGYQSFFHPINQYKGIGVCFKEAVSNSIAYPVIVFTNISGMKNVLVALGL
ncbi:MAG: sialidase family protein [Salinivirgaceae bacterium]|jgi:hypothetical protein